MNGINSLFISFCLNPESPVALEFTPVLGILIGVVATMLLVAFVIILVLRIKYKTGKRINGKTTSVTMHSNSGRRYETAALDNHLKAKATPNQKDEEEYFCLPQPEPEDGSNGRVGESHTITYTQGKQK